MTVEHLVECPDCGEVYADPLALEFCETHDSVLRALLIQRGFGADLELTDEQRRNMVEGGKRDAYSEVVQSMMFGVITMFGPATMAQSNGCPVCVLEGTLERAADEVVNMRRKSN